MGRKQKYEGITVRSETTIEITFHYKGTRCREAIKRKPTAGNLKFASNYRGEILIAIDDGTFIYSETFPNSKNAAKFESITNLKMPTVKELLLAYFKRHEAVFKSSTKRDYRNTINNHLIPKFGDKYIDELNHDDIIEWHIEKGVTNKRMSNLITPLRVAMNEAIPKYIHVNFLNGWSHNPQEKPRKSKIDPFNAEEQSAILSVLSGQAYNLVAFAFWTGLRTSELCALNWSEVDFIGKKIEVFQAQTRDAIEPETPKTKAGIRFVDLLPPALAAIKSQKKFSFLHESSRVFLNPRTGEPWAGDGPIRKTLWVHALKRAGVRYRYQYQTRHTFASMMISVGEPPLWVAHQLGHATVEMVNRNYAKWIPDKKEKPGLKAVEKFYNRGAT